MNFIRLFWWNEKKLQKKNHENYGDLIGKYLVEKITNKRVIWTNPRIFSFLNFLYPIYFTTGSILSHVNRNCIVWGSGIISKNIIIKKAKFLAVRGPQTRNYLRSLGYNVPEVYGDPAILLPKIYNPVVDKKYSLGIIPHYVDKSLVSNLEYDSIKIIDVMTNDIEKTTLEILQCKKIISSSLHGIIVSHAYNIPAIWFRFSSNIFGDDIKFKDYFESVKIESYKPNDKIDILEFEKAFNIYPNLPKRNVIKNIQNKLLETCPF